MQDAMLPLDYLQYIAKCCFMPKSHRSSYNKCMKWLIKADNIDLRRAIDSAPLIFEAYKPHALPSIDAYRINTLNKYNIPLIKDLLSLVELLPVEEDMYIVVWYAITQHNYNANNRDIYKIGPLTYIGKSVDDVYFIFDYSNNIGKLYLDEAFKSTCTHTLAWKRFKTGERGPKVDPGRNVLAESICNASNIFLATALNLRAANEAARHTMHVEVEDRDRDCCVCYCANAPVVLECGHRIHESCLEKCIIENHCSRTHCIICIINTRGTTGR